MSDENNKGVGTAVQGVGGPRDGRTAPGEQGTTLTTRQGHPVSNNQNLRTVGNRGPATLENYQFIEKISHFDRERVPERVVHARGAGAHGVFEAYGTVGGEPIAKYTRAKLFNTKGKETPVFVRFSTVAGAKESPETERDPRGFAVKFYTSEGNFDLVGKCWVTWPRGVWDRTGSLEIYSRGGECARRRLRRGNSPVCTPGVTELVDRAQKGCVCIYESC